VWMTPIARINAGIGISVLAVTGTPPEPPGFPQAQLARKGSSLGEELAAMLEVRDMAAVGYHHARGAPPGSESPDSRDWMSAVTESGGWSASTATRMPRSV
jgi:hypothetical protein